MDKPLRHSFTKENDDPIHSDLMYQIYEFFHSNDISPENMDHMTIEFDSAWMINQEKRIHFRNDKYKIRKNFKPYFK